MEEAVIPYPCTALEWWSNVNTNWKDLWNMGRVYLDAPTAMQMDLFRIGRNNKLSDVLRQLWYTLPDSPRARTLPGFGVLCDLCSERHVLENNEK